MEMNSLGDERSAPPSGRSGGGPAKTLSENLDECAAILREVAEGAPNVLTMEAAEEAARAIGLYAGGAEPPAPAGELKNLREEVRALTDEVFSLAGQLRESEKRLFPALLSAVKAALPPPGKDSLTPLLSLQVVQIVLCAGVVFFVAMKG